MVATHSILRAMTIATRTVTSNGVTGMMEIATKLTSVLPIVAILTSAMTGASGRVTNQNVTGMAEIASI